MIVNIIMGFGKRLTAATKTRKFKCTNLRELEFSNHREYIFFRKS